MSLLPFASGLALLAGIGLGYVRCKSDGGEAPRPLAIIALAASFAASGAAFCVLLVGLDESNLVARLDVETYAGMAALGATLGTTLFLAVRVLGIELTASLWHWCCRLPRDVERSPIEFLTTTSAGLVGFAGTLAVVFVIGHAVSPALAIWLMPFFVSLIPLYETLCIPWLQYARAPTLTSARLGDLETWIESLRIKRGLPRIRVRIQNGPSPNAFAIGGLGAHLIVIGKGLVDGLSPQHLQAVVAHEVAHVARRDVPRLLLPLLMVGGTLHATCVVSFSHPLFSREEFWTVASGVVLTGLFAGMFVVVLPGFFMRRMEFGADRLAAELLGDGEQLAQALERLCELSGQSLSKWSWSHPPTDARIEAIRSFASQP